MGSGDETMPTPRASPREGVGSGDETRGSFLSLNPRNGSGRGAAHTLKSRTLLVEIFGILTEILKSSVKSDSKPSVIL